MIAVQHLGASSRPALLTHLLALSTDDRRLRFGAALSSEALAAYVDGIDFRRDAVFAVHDDRLALLGVAHVGFGDDIAELGLSVLPGHRASGIGSTLFERGACHARNRRVPHLLMHCLAENGPVMRMARRFGMQIVAASGDADAHLALPPASAGSITREFVDDRFALYDYAMKSQVMAWHGVNAVLVGAAPQSGDDAGAWYRA